MRSLERTSRRCCCRPSPSCTRDEPGGPEYELRVALRDRLDVRAAARRPARDARARACCFDASAPGELAALHVQALELMLRRAGLRTLTLTAATRAGAARPCAARAAARRARARRRARLARRDGPPRLRGAQRARGDRRARLRRRAARHRREHRAPPRRRTARRARRAAGAPRRRGRRADVPAAAPPTARSSSRAATPRRCRSKQRLRYAVIHRLHWHPWPASPLRSVCASRRRPTVCIAAEAKRTKRSKGSVVESLAEEALKARLIPGVAFRGDDYKRRAWLIGTSLDVWQVIEAYQDFDRSFDRMIAETDLGERELRAAVTLLRAIPSGDRRLHRVEWTTTR